MFLPGSKATVLEADSPVRVAFAAVMQKRKNPINDAFLVLASQRAGGRSRTKEMQLLPDCSVNSAMMYYNR